MTDSSCSINSVEITVRGQALTLRADGTVFLPEHQVLLVSDLHLGKEHSFRAGGIPVPDGPTQTTLDLLANAITDCLPERVIILGDMIHDRNSMTPAFVHQFREWRVSFERVKLTLVRGNHDRHVSSFPTQWNMTTLDELRMESLTLVHAAPEETSNAEAFYIEGHWHPVTKIGRGADELRVRCFVHRNDRLTLPAFGPFKGGLNVNKRRANRYAILENQIFKIDV